MRRPINRLLNAKKVICAAALAAAVAGGSLCAQSVDELVEKGSAYDLQFQPQQALEYYLPAEKQDPNNVDLLVRIARQYRHLMQDTSSKAKKLEYGSLALEYSRRAARLDPGSADAQVAEAITYGKMMPLLGNREKIEASRAIKRSVDRALAADSRNDTAWFVLGRWQFGMAELTGVKRSLAQVAHGKLPTSSYQEAAESFQRAVALNPGRLMFYIELGRAYAAMGRTKEARQMIERGLAMPSREKDDVEAKERGREALGRL